MTKVVNMKLDFFCRSLIDLINQFADLKKKIMFVCPIFPKNYDLKK